MQANCRCVRAVGKSFGDPPSRRAANKHVPDTPSQTVALRALFEPVREWFDAEVERIASVESVVAHHEWGYAGTVDLVAKLKSTGGWAVVDFKTQRVKRDAKGAVKPTFYETWPLQLEAYRQAILHSGEGKQPADCVSIVIGSTEAVPIVTKVWPREEYEGYWKAFLNARSLWVWTKGYCPIDSSVG